MKLGVMECVLNVWQLLKQPDLTARALERRQIWIEQNKATHLGRSLVAIVTGNNSLTWLFVIKIYRWNCGVSAER